MGKSAEKRTERYEGHIGAAGNRVQPRAVQRRGRAKGADTPSPQIYPQHDGEVGTPAFGTHKVAREARSPEARPHCEVQEILETTHREKSFPQNRFAEE